jgi:hypothetical protein
MYINPSSVTMITLILIGILLTLYMMRRRVRLGRKKGTF